VSAEAQLAGLADVVSELEAESIDYWLLGGWAVDFHVGLITREHTDVDLAVLVDDLLRIRELLEDAGWRHAPQPWEDGGTGFERDGVRVELTYVVHLQDGTPAIPFRAGPAAWDVDALGQEVRELAGVRCRLISRAALVRGKSTPRADPDDAARDRADYRALRQVLEE
jgi:hypothetical protein